MRVLAATLMILPLAACGMSAGKDNAPGIAGTGSGGTRSYAASGFSRVELAGADDVDVTIGSSFAVRAEGASEDLDRLRIRVKGDSLLVDRRHGEGVSFGNGHKVTVHVTLPRLAAASVAGSGTITAERAEGDGFKGELAGSGDLVLRALAVSKAEFDLAGSGSVKAAGTTKSLEINIAGSGGFSAADLHATSADISVAGSGDVRANVAGPADISIMGSGDIDLGPQARCKTTKMGSGSVRCGG